MGYTNETLHYGIPKPLGTDLTVPQDYNDAADAIDQALFDASTNATEAVTAAANAVEAAAEAVEDVGDLGTEVNNLKGRTSALETSDVIQNNKIDNLENQGVTKFDSAGVADPYVNGLTYSVGDVVTYNGQRYKCTTAVVAAEPFDADKWTAEDVETVLNNIKSDLSEITSDVIALKSTVNANVAGTTVTLTHNQRYTAPSDGYIEVQSSTSSNPGGVSATLYGSVGTSVIGICNEPESPTTSRQYLIYVKKGMVVKAAIYGNASIKFTPITS